VLGYTNPNEAIQDHVDDEDKLNSKTLSSLGQRGGWFVNESGMYSLILRSNKPEAKTFKRWITHEVLPSIRKTGSYTHPASITRDKSVQDRKELTAQWQAHGANGYDYANLTREQYAIMFGDPSRRKAEMSKGELVALNAFDAIETWKLSIDQTTNGCKELKGSLKETGNLMTQIAGQVSSAIKKVLDS
jgi:prophage antirepressor-like protein